MSRFIQKKIQVANPGATMVHHHDPNQQAKVFNPLEENVFLVGLRASGKSTLGQELAQRLGMRFVDTDEVITRAAERCIAEIVTSHGWEEFRRLETEALQNICADTGQVVATGGGIVLAPENLKLLQHSGTTFYLMAEIPTLLKRLTSSGSDPQRPPLSDLPLEQELIRSNAQRGPLYMCAATHILRTEEFLEKTLEDALEKLGVC